MTLKLKTFLKCLNPVYGRGARASLLGALVLFTSFVTASPSALAQDADSVIVDARDALRAKDRNRLGALRDLAVDTKHPLAMWPDYWDLTNRISEVQQAEVTLFTSRWKGTYVEDRLRNDWLLELGKRKDWVNFAAEYPRFRMNDDREVSCYALLLEQFAGKDVHDAALAAWLGQRDADDGCGLLASTLFDAKQFTDADAWRKARFSIDAGRPRAARQAVALIGVDQAGAVGDLTDSPARYLARNGSASTRGAAELTTLALMRMASNDPDAAAGLLNDRWDRALPSDLAAWAWAATAKQAAMKLQPEAADYFQHADQRAATKGHSVDWPDDTLAWEVRAALRADNGHPRWQQVTQAIDAMGESEQRDPAWVYWKSRALLSLAADSQDGESIRTLAREQMGTIAGQMNFYAGLAAQTLGRPIFMPARPTPLTPEERDAATNTPGLQRALELIGIGLRSEGVREWNFTLRGMGDRELLAAAQLACDRQVWDRCINTSDRTRSEIDMDQRFPMPFRKEITSHAAEVGIDPAYVFGLIRQESRFSIDARSGVGASGLMQLMPATARWTAKKIGMSFSNDMLADRDTNLKLGTAYLKLVLDDFGGLQALAAAAYNAGPNRARKWRDGPVLETAVWAENVPFPETRDYVKKVLSNAAYYTAQLGGGQSAAVKRLDQTVAPATQPNPLDKDLP